MLSEILREIGYIEDEEASSCKISGHYSWNKKTVELFVLPDLT